MPAKRGRPPIHPFPNIKPGQTASFPMAKHSFQSILRLCSYWGRKLGCQFVPRITITRVR